MYVDFQSVPPDYRTANYDSSLQQLFKSAVTHAQDRIDWYEQKSGGCAGQAKRLRPVSLIEFARVTCDQIFDSSGSGLRFRQARAKSPRWEGKFPPKDKSLA